MEAALRCRRVEGRTHGHGARIWRRTAVPSGPVRHLSRNSPRARRQTRGTSLAFPSALVSNPGKFALARFPEGPRQPDRGPGGKEPGEPEITPVGTRGARMGQAVDRRPGRDLTYNTRFGWLIFPIPSKNHALLKPKPHLRWCKPRQRRVRSANRRRKGIVRRVIVHRAAGDHRDRAARAEGREIAKAE